MAEFPSMPLLTDAYIADTQHLTNEEHGVYFRLLMFAWRTSSCSLPDDDKRLATMVGVTVGKWAKLKPIIMGFWSLEDGEWTQKKQLSQRAFVERNRQQKSRAGKASAKAKSLKTKKPPLTADITADATAGQQSTTITNTKVKGKPLTPHTPKGGSADLVNEFERMWGFYPRKIGKGNAKKAFIKARGKASLSEIAYGMKAFVDNINGTPMDKIPHAATWLNQERWLDDQSHAANRGQTSEDDLRSLGAPTAADDIGTLFSDQPRLEGNHDGF